MMGAQNTGGGMQGGGMAGGNMMGGRSFAGGPSNYDMRGGMTGNAGRGYMDNVSTMEYRPPQMYGGWGRPTFNPWQQAMHNGPSAEQGVGRGPPSGNMPYGGGGKGGAQPTTTPMGGDVRNDMMKAAVDPQPGGMNPAAEGNMAQPAPAAQPAVQPAVQPPAASHMGNFRQLMGEDPFLAKQYADMNQQWFQQNQRDIGKQFFGGNDLTDQQWASQGDPRMNAWVNDNSAGGGTWNQRGGNALSNDVLNRLRTMSRF